MESSGDRDGETSEDKKPLSSIVVVGASAGGVETLKEFIATLPDDVPFAIAIVLHIRADSSSQLPRILNRYGKLKAIHPRSGELIQPGTIYIAPPDHHLVIREPRLYLTRGPKENNCRPSIDVLFRTAAYSYGPRVIGIVLSGTLDDGTAGLIAIKEAGGVSIVQNPKEALWEHPTFVMSINT
ncbi:MAG: Protein-glutamate methylesterase/protein-glutamine glutaminase [Chroococcopsis gigantea SAG 12.99]|jgi:two-component system chemotaxis response regulator CheB|nr:Protein-glutamate methylesterase/protein-glutamine glutaminase [Chroococcopsis gigantea SAG 12.99]